jgi:rhodanese-related sulfurtransferase/pimeloyl-ACP methyl ester carboxylesterase
LGITNIDLLLGGSFGGSQALEMAFCKELSINKMTLIATGAKESARNIAIHEAQRIALAADPTLTENNPDSGNSGLKAARAIGLLTYRTYDAFELQQTNNDHRLDDFRAASYIQYQGDKLVKRFHAHNYWHLTKCMDSHNLGRNRNGIENALKQIKIATTVIGINTDELIPTREQKFIQQNIPECSYYEISSDYGHDGFLIETDKIGKIINQQLNKPTTNKTNETMVKEITVTELKELFDNKDDFQLIDVREAFETEIATIGGELIPQGQVLDEHLKVSTEKKVVIYCRSGIRSANAIEALQHLNGFDNLYNLKGGILAWADEIDASIEKY